MWTGIVEFSHVYIVFNGFLPFFFTERAKPSALVAQGLFIEYAIVDERISRKKSAEFSQPNPIRWFECNSKSWRIQPYPRKIWQGRVGTSLMVFIVIAQVSPNTVEALWFDSLPPLTIWSYSPVLNSLILQNLPLRTPLRFTTFFTLRSFQWILQCVTSIKIWILT